MNIEFERLNNGWDPEPNAPEEEITVSGSDVMISFLLNPFLSGDYKEGDRAALTFHDCLQYRYGSPNDEGFYVFNESRFKEFGVEWGEFYKVTGSDWETDFPDPISVSEQAHDGLNHYLLYLRDGTFECIARDYELTLNIQRI